MPFSVDLKGKFQAEKYLLINDALKIVWSWGSEYSKDVVELVEVMFSGENRPVGKHFSKNTTH